MLVKFNLIILGFIMLISSCNGDNGIISPDINQKTYYQQTIQPIFNSSCAGSACHIGGNAGNVRLGNYSLSLESSGIKLGKTIIPGDANNSPIIQIVSGLINGLPMMPIGNPRLTDDQIEILRNWIQNDAMED